MDKKNSDGSIGDVPSDSMPNEGERRKHDYEWVKEVLEGPACKYSFPSFYHGVIANPYCRCQCWHGEGEVLPIHPPLGRVLF